MSGSNKQGPTLQKLLKFFKNSVDSTPFFARLDLVGGVYV